MHNKEQTVLGCKSHLKWSLLYLLLSFYEFAADKFFTVLLMYMLHILYQKHMKIKKQSEK